MKYRILTLLTIMLLPLLIRAHEIRPAYLEIKEAADHSLQITWKQPLMGEYGLPLHPVITAGWLADSTATVTHTEYYIIKRWKVVASHATLDQQTISIGGLEKTMTDVLLQIILQDERTYSYLLKPMQPSVTLALSAPPSPPVWHYMQMGMHHIWSGFDHLLFVFGLLLLVNRRSLLIWTITAFTVAHSITLALATFECINVSASFTEAAIALSIVFLAVEIVRHYNGKNGFTYYYPWLVSFFFGLLHGLGFASALQQVGLPADNIPLALLLFNAGVEVGQLTFVSVVLLAGTAVRSFAWHFPVGLRKIPPYITGTLAMYWFIERVIAIFH